VVCTFGLAERPKGKQGVIPCIDQQNYCKAKVIACIVLQAQLLSFAAGVVAIVGAGEVCATCTFKSGTHHFFLAFQYMGFLLIARRFFAFVGGVNLMFFVLPLPCEDLVSA
jgi:hypothetical protein